jgi:XamI restriction endonuclease.
MLPSLPPNWPSSRLEEDRLTAIASFVVRRLKEGDPEYLHKFAESEELIRRMFSLTDDLTAFDEAHVAGHPALLLDIARFTAGPPVSADDFWTLLSIKKRKNLPTGNVAAAVSLLHGLLDMRRFAWVREGRLPTGAEKEIAIVATASLRAVERARTSRRSAEQARQEALVATKLESAGVEAVHTAKHPDKDLPPGSFKKGFQFEGKQCDILVRLHDERFLAIECKSSNSAVNSVKRLNDVNEKADVWRKERGAKVVTAAVIAGVFGLADLEKAQQKGVFLFWEHDLTPLLDYVSATKTTS